MRTARRVSFLGSLPLLLVALAVQTQARATETPLDEAVKLIQEVAQAYKEAPAFTDKIQMTTTVRSKSQSESIGVAMGAGSDAQVRWQGHILTAVDQRLFVHREQLPGKYYATALTNNIVETYRGLANGQSLPAPQCALRYGKSLDDYVAAFGMATASNLTLVGHRMTDLGGRPAHELEFTTDRGATIKGFIDPDRKFIVKVEIDFGPVNVSYSMNPKRHDQLPQPIAFDKTDRRLVESVLELKLATGDTAPDFTLKTLDGQSVTLGEHRGSVVVLDFWATWCPPCRMSLPKLQQFADWAEQDGRAVKVYAVDIFERVQTNEQKKQVVSQFWKKRGFTMPTLMDYDNSVAEAFEVEPIPHMVVIGPQGKIIKIHIGFDPNMVQTLKRETLESLHGDS